MESEIIIALKKQFKQRKKMEKHREIDFYFGNITDAVIELSKYKERGEKVYIVFNGKKIYSDIDDINSAYEKITGITKSEFDAKIKLENDKYKEKEKRHKENIPKLTNEWIEKGKLILDEKYHETWAECVPIRLGDLYRGMELGATLDIIKELNADCELDVVKEIIYNQGHSGMSFGLVCSMVRDFCDRGIEFVKYVK